MNRKLLWAAAAALICACNPDVSLPPPPSGNNGTGDKTPPNFSGFAVTPPFAKSGTKVTFSFDSTEDLPKTARGDKPNPEVTFGDEAMSCTATGLHYDCSSVVSDSVAEGSHSFVIVGRDGSGNESEPLTATVTVTVDRTPPVLTVRTTPQQLVSGGLFAFTVTSDEDLGAAPAIQAGFVADAPQCVGTVPGKSFTCNSAVPSTTPAGNVSFTATGVDRAGNSSTSPVATSEVKPPTGSVPVITAKSVTPAIAALNSPLSITFTADQALTFCAVTVGGKNGNCTLPNSTPNCSCTYQVASDTPEGQQTVSMQASGAGGVGSEVLTVEIDLRGPLVSASEFVVTRNPRGTADLVRGTGSAAADSVGPAYTARGVVAIKIWNGFTAATPLLTVAFDGGGFTDLPLPGTQDAGFPVIYASAVDVPGNESVRTIVDSDISGPTGDGGLLTIIRRPLDEVDTVAGSAGAFSDRSSVVGVRVVTQSGLLISSGPSSVDGQFSELPIADAGTSLARVWVQGVDKAGNIGSTVEAMVGRDLAAPFTDGGQLVINRLPMGQPDTVEGLAGAFADQSALSRILIYSNSVGSVLIGQGEGNASYGFSAVPVGDGGSSFPSVWVRAYDKAGIPSPLYEAQVGRDTQGPFVTAALMKINRLPVGQVDTVEGYASTFTDVSAIRLVTLYNSLGAPIATGPSNAGKGFDPIALGDGGTGYSRVLVGATDKAGNSTSLNVEVTNGADLFAPVGDGGLIQFVRTPFGQQDELRGLAHAFTDESAIATVAVHSASSGGALLTQGPANLDGGFDALPLPFNDAGFAYERVWVTATDKLNRTSGRVEAMVGRDTSTPSLDRTRMTINRKDFTQPDSVSATAGAINDPSYVQVSLRSPSTTTIASGSSDSTGGFPEIEIGDAGRSYGRVWISVLDKTGRQTFSPLEILNGTDVASPTVDGNAFTIVRRDVTDTDGVSGAVASVVDVSASWVLLEGNVGSSFSYVPLGTADVAANGSVAELRIGDAGSSYSRVYVTARDKIGQITLRIPVQNGTDTVGPAGDGTLLSILRNPAGQQDAVRGDAGAFADALTPLTTVSVYSSNSNAAQYLLGTTTLHQNGGFDPLFVGTPIESAGRMWFQAKDKAGNTSSLVEALNGQDLVGPAAPNGGQMAIVRRPIGQADSIFADGGVFTDVNDVFTVRFYGAADGTRFAGGGPVDGVGGFAEIPIGDDDTSFGRIWAQAADKAGVGGPLVEVVTGADTIGPVVDAGAFSVVRRDLTQRDSVVGTAGGVVAQGCPPRELRLHHNLIGYEMARGPLLADGTFPETFFGSVLQSAQTVRLEAMDKCDNLGVNGPLVVNGADFTAPNVDTSVMHFVGNPHPGVDVVWADAGAITDSNAIQRVRIESFSGNNLAQPALDPSGGFAEVSLGATLHLGVNVQVVDKASNSTPKLRVQGEATVNLSGRGPYDAGFSPMAFYAFAADRDPSQMREVWGISLSPEAPVSMISRALAVDVDRAVTMATPAQADAGFWSQLSTGAFVPARMGHQMTYDQARDQVVMFGGEGTSGVLDDTHLFINGNWYNPSGFYRPEARRYHELTYDPVSSTCRMEGGERSDGSRPISGGTFLGDSWGSGYYNGGSIARPLTYDLAGRTFAVWNPDTRSFNGFFQNPSPDAGSHYAMTYDSQRGVFVHFGGLNSSGIQNDTWEFGSSWTQKSPATSPPPLYGPAFAYDSVRGRTLLFGGSTNVSCCTSTSLFNQSLWEYDGTNWTQVSVPGTGPSGRMAAAMVFDPIRNRTLMFGGHKGSAITNELWQYVAPTPAHARYAAQLFVVELGSAPSGVQVRYVGSGLGDNGGVATPGVKLFRRTSTGFVPVGENFALDADSEAQRTISGTFSFPGASTNAQRYLYLLVQSTHPSSVPPGTLNSSVSTDYLELKVTQP